MRELNSENLGQIAEWLDLSDQLLSDYAELLRSFKEIKEDGSIEIKIPENSDALARIIERTVGSSEMQDDIRRWAELLKNYDWDECLFDCDWCHDC